MTNVSKLKLICEGSGYWPLLYPRIYKHIDAFGDPAVPAAAFTLAAEAVRTRGAAVTHVQQLAARLAENKMPTIFIDPAFARAALLSPPPADLIWADVKLPHEQAVVILPRGAVKFPNGNDVEFIAYARIPRGEVFTPLGSSRMMRFEEADAFLIYTADANDPAFAGDERSLRSDLQPTLESIHYTPEQMFFNDNDGGGSSDEFDLYQTLDDYRLSEQITSLLFSILLAVTARPMLIETGRRQGKHKKSGRPIWTPNVVGRGYRHRSEPSGDSSGGTVRMHWRRGHYRQQPFGEGRRDHKIIWIEPTLIGGTR